MDDAPSIREITFELSKIEAQVLIDLCDQVAELIGTDISGDRAVDRLFPRAHLDPTDDKSEVEWQRLVHSDLKAAKLSAVGEMREAIRICGPDRQFRLEETACEVWLTALNDIRLILGTRLEITETTDFPEVTDEAGPSKDERASGLALYQWLTYFQGMLLELIGDYG